MIKLFAIHLLGLSASAIANEGGTYEDHNSDEHLRTDTVYEAPNKRHNEHDCAEAAAQDCGNAKSESERTLDR